MPLPADYHMHTPLCRHASGEPSEYAAQALKIGLQEIGFSDHSPMARDDFDDWRMRRDELDSYVEEVEKARRDHPQLTIKLALEMDYLPGHEEWIREIAARHPWDYLIGSVHYVLDDWDFDNPQKIARWQEHDPGEIWSDYFERLIRAAESGLFQILGHMDLCKKFGFHPKADCTPLFRRALEAAKKSNMAMELNTAGLRKQCREIYPAARIVEMAAELDLPITFGSDAHAVAEVGWHFDEAVALAKRAGYSHWCRFSGKRREQIRL